jgi:hypothetical protein
MFLVGTLVATKAITNFSHNTYVGTSKNNFLFLDIYKEPKPLKTLCKLFNL